jgi:hypothetical protein
MKYPLFLADINFDIYFNNPRLLNFMKFLRVTTEMHAGGQTGGDNKTNSAFAIFPTSLKIPTSTACPGPFCIQLGHKL